MKGTGITHAFEALWQLIKGTNYDHQLKNSGLDPEEMLSDNIYNAEMTRKDFLKKANRIHSWFKHIFLIPGLHYAEKLLGKHLVTEVPNKPHYKNLVVFETAFKNTMIDWEEYSPSSTYKKTSESMRSGMPVKWMTQLKNLIMTVVMNDTAYLEVFNMLMYRIARHMNEAYPENEGIPKHLLYLGPGIRDVRYFGIVQEKMLDKLFPDRAQTVIKEFKGNDYPRHSIPVMSLKPPIKHKTTKKV